MDLRAARSFRLLRLVAAQMLDSEREPVEAAWHLCGRVGAMGRAAIASSPQGQDLELLIRDELLACAARAERLSVEGPPLRLNRKAADLLVLIVHELSINAVKFGALSQPSALLSVSWHAQAEGAPMLHIDWQESGVALDPGEAHAKGFGAQVVERLLAEELHGRGRILLRPEGVQCRMEIPLSEALYTNE